VLDTEHLHRYYKIFIFLYKNINVCDILKCKLVSMNSGYKYLLLCAIDVCSRKVFVGAIKNIRDIADSMNDILSDKQPIVLQTYNRI
jgi:hypothetical protein